LLWDAFSQVPSGYRSRTLGWLLRGSKQVARITDVSGHALKIEHDRDLFLKE